MNQQARMFLTGLGIPAVDAEIALSAPAATHAIGHVADFIAKPTERILLLSGKPGCGKTIAAAHWLANLPRYAKHTDTPEGWGWAAGRAQFVSAYAISRLNLRYRDEDRAAMDGWKRSTWLVIDDLGTEAADALSVVEELIDARCRIGWTVITTNLPAKKLAESDFAKRYGERIASRIFGNGRVGVCGSQDLRTGGAA